MYPDELVANGIKQVFCKYCAGLVRLYVNGTRISAVDWHKYGMSSDIGCICKALHINHKH
jgi:hypothetical protein